MVGDGAQPRAVSREKGGVHRLTKPPTTQHVYAMLSIDTAIAESTTTYSVWVKVRIKSTRRLPTFKRVLVGMSEDPAVVERLLEAARRSLFPSDAQPPPPGTKPGAAS